MICSPLLLALRLKLPLVSRSRLVWRSHSKITAQAFQVTVCSQFWTAFEGCLATQLLHTFPFSPNLTKLTTDRIG
jgi:hypothetical protein